MDDNEDDFKEIDRPHFTKTQKIELNTDECNSIEHLEDDQHRRTSSLSKTMSKP